MTKQIVSSTRLRVWALAVVTAAAQCLTVRSAVFAEPGADPSRVTFVACPTYRDTDRGRKSGCWLATDPTSNTTYDVSFAPIKPQRDHEVLVEGVVTEEPDLCGGAVLKPVRVAVLPSVCKTERLAAAPYTGRPSPPPTETLRPASEPRTLPEPPYPTREFNIYFEFGRDFLSYQHAEIVLEKVMLYVQASGAPRVDIAGYAATKPVLVSGRSLEEPLALAEARANIAAEALRRLHLPASILHVSGHGEPSPTDLEGGHLPEPSKRRVTITVTP